MISRTLPSREYLRQCFSYDPETGLVRWLHRPRAHFRTNRIWKMWNTINAGNVVGSPGTRGYLRVTLDRQQHLLHRVIWKWMTDETPVNVDHRNHHTDDNRWDKLRHATIAENTHHMHGHRDRKYPGALKGAYRHKSGWLSFIGFGGKQHYIGIFKTEIEAHDAYCAKAQELHGEFWKPDNRSVSVTSN